MIWAPTDQHAYVSSSREDAIGKVLDGEVAVRRYVNEGLHHAFRAACVQSYNNAAVE